MDQFVNFLDPIKQKFLAQNFFAATCDNVAYQLSSLGGSFHSSIDNITYTVDFAGDLTAERTNDDLRITNADGSHATLTKLSDVAASETFKRLALEPLPSVRLPKYLAALPDGRYFYVDTPKYSRPLDDELHAYLGTQNNMRQVSVMNVESYRDGGTTYVYTDAGTLFSPVSLDPTATAPQPTFTDASTDNEIAIELLDVSSSSTQLIVASFGIPAGIDNLHVPTF